jgi:hypothetical protein
MQLLRHLAFGKLGEGAREGGFMRHGSGRVPAAQVAQGAVHLQMVKKLARG